MTNNLNGDRQILYIVVGMLHLKSSRNSGVIKKKQMLKYRKAEVGL